MYCRSTSDMKKRTAECTFIYTLPPKAKKNRLLDENNKVAFELDNCRDYVEGSITSLYESVAGCGVMTEIADMSEKLSALGLILKQYGEKTYKPDSSCASRTRVYRLEVKEVSGKANRGK